MKSKLIIALLAITMTSLSACGNKNAAAFPVDIEPIAEVTETEETKDSEPVEAEKPEPEPAEEEEPDEDKPLDLDSLENLKWVMEALVTLEKNSDSSYIHDLYSGEENAVISMLWYMDYCDVENPKGEDIRIGDDENGWDGYVRFTTEQIQEVMNSLTGQQIDISSVGENGVIDISLVGMIESLSEYKNWNTEYIGDNIWKINVDEYNVFDGRFDDDSSYKISEITFTVTENPDSIFDGYSIIEVEEVAPKMSEWATAYYDYLLENFYNSLSEEKEYFKYMLIYLDNDDIPELYVHVTDFTGDRLLYYFDGQVNEKNCGDLPWYQYIPQSGLLMEEWDIVTAHGNIVSQFVNGEFTDMAEGHVALKEEYREEYPGENWMYDYMFNGETVSEEEYSRRLNEVFDTSKAILLVAYNDNAINIYSMLNMLTSQ